MMLVLEYRRSMVIGNCILTIESKLEVSWGSSHENVTSLQSYVHYDHSLSSFGEDKFLDSNIQRNRMIFFCPLLFLQPLPCFSCVA
jgi:hypothetical protein